MTRFDLGDRLVFAVGLEDTAIGAPVRGGNLPLDEYDLTGHTEQWRADLDRARLTGASVLRYGLPWYRLNPAPGVFDWRWSDQVAEYLGHQDDLRVIVDLVHYGTPLWLEGSFADPGFPAAIEQYAGAMAHRYQGVFDAYTPLNEPLVTASFCGLRGIWPPYLNGDEGWSAIVVAITSGVQAAMRAVRESDANAEIVHVEAVQMYSAEDPALGPEVQHWEDRAQLPTRLLLGQVGPQDAAWHWLCRHGVSPQVLESLSGGGCRPDVLGLNYYPELSCRELVRLHGRTVHVAIDGGAARLARALRASHTAYHLPLMVTETGIEGGPDKKKAWLDALISSLASLRSEGVRVTGLTWWPLIDFVDWSWASGGLAVEEFFHRDGPGQAPQPVAPLGDPGGPIGPFLRRMGIYQLEPSPANPLEREPTELLEYFRARATNPLRMVPVRAPFQEHS